MFKVDLFVDGSCLGNPGPGGWCALLRCGEREKTIIGFSPSTTNNTMELEAVVGGLMSLKQPAEITVYTDSAGLVGWVTGEWRCRHPHLMEVVVRLKKLVSSGGHSLAFSKIVGHSGHRENEYCDRMAKLGARKQEAVILNYGPLRPEQNAGLQAA